MTKHQDKDIESLLTALQENQHENYRLTTFAAQKAAKKCLAEVLRLRSKELCAPLAKGEIAFDECTQIADKCRKLDDLIQTIWQFMLHKEVSQSVRKAIKEGAESLHKQLFPRDYMSPEDQEKWRLQMQEYLRGLEKEPKEDWEALAWHLRQT